MAENYVLLQRIELTASSSSVTFTNIPQSGYTDLKFVVSARSNYSAIGSGADLKFNNSSTGYSYKQLYGYSGGAGSVGNSSTTAISFNIAGATSTTSTFSPVEFYIPNAFGNNYKSVSIEGANENNSTTGWQLDMFAYLWSNTASISTITLTENNSSTFVAGSTFSLYGLAAVGTTPAIAPKASGGNITTDGTYWIHTFLTSGTFTPATNLTCDYLVIAGGGGGGSYGGGGGAGGLRSTVTATGGGGSLGSALGVTSGTAYTVTVGAGGAGGTGGLNGSNGNDSIFSTITSIGGGAGGAYNAGYVNGLNGGSGGGGGMTDSGQPTPTAGTGTTAQGFAGGNGIASTSNSRSGGGGGGAGAVGTAGSSTNAGSGGNGVAVAISGSSVTYAGGGAGMYDYRTTGTAGTAGTGGGGTAASSGGTGGNGGTNLGGGGGAGTYNTNFTNGGAGGSGIVIVRYTVA